MPARIRPIRGDRTAAGHINHSGRFPLSSGITQGRTPYLLFFLINTIFPVPTLLLFIIITSYLSYIIYQPLYAS